MSDLLPSDSPLGRPSAQPERVDAVWLCPLPRAPHRAALGWPGALPFVGADLWTAYELSWLNPRGKPQLAIAELTVPCDSPCFPTDLVARLAQAASEADAQIAMAATREPDGTLQPQPVHSLLHVSVRDSLAAFLAAGHRKVDRWTAQHRCVTVVFDDAQAFFNANTLADLEQLQPSRPR